LARQPQLTDLLFAANSRYQTGRLLIAAAYVFIGPLWFLGWPPDFVHRWWVLIPICILGIVVFLTWRHLKTRHYNAHPLAFQGTEPELDQKVHRDRSA